MEITYSEIKVEWQIGDRIFWLKVPCNYLELTDYMVERMQAEELRWLNCYRTKEELRAMYLEAVEKFR